MTPDELLAAIRQHPHCNAVLAQFESDMRDGLDIEEYDGESRERSEIWALLYELVAGEPSSDAPKPPAVSPPGATLADWMDERGNGHAPAMEALGLSADELDAYIAGKRRTTLALATKLAALTGVERRFWVRRELQYRADRKWRSA